MDNPIKGAAATLRGAFRRLSAGMEPPGARVFPSLSLAAFFQGLSAAILILTISSIGIMLTAGKSKEAIEAQLGELLIHSAKSLASILDTSMLAGLSVPEDEAAHPYKVNFARIHGYRERNPEFRYAYTCRLAGDSVVFLVDGSPPGDKDKDGVEDHSALMDPYPDASETLKRVLIHGGTGYDKKPYTDKWGTFQSGCAAIGGAGAAPIAAACVDMDVSGFNSRMAGVGMAARFGFALSLALSLGMGFAFMLMRSNQIMASNRLLVMGRDLENRNMALIASQKTLVEAQRQGAMGHWTFHPATRESEWSQEMYRIHDREPGQGPIGEAEMLAAVHPDDMETLKANIRASLEDGLPREWNYRKRLRDGSIRHLFVRMKPERGLRGKVAVIHGVTQDMTRWHAIEDELIKAKVNAEKSSQAKSQFLAMMSHEIRTPMNGVLGMAHILKGSPLSADQQSLLTTLLESGEHLLTLINDILDFSKIDAGRMELEAIPFNLKRLSGSVCAILREKAAENGIELRESIGVEPWERFQGDPGRIRQILFNLLGNAVKFTQEGHVHLTVDYAADRPGWISLTVEDTGIGMTEAQIANLFRPFMQVDSSTSRKFGGTGLGLAITLQLVNLMNGHVNVKSLPGRGSRFEVLLPLAALQLGDAMCDSIPPDTPETHIPSQAGLRAILVDDRDSSRMIIRKQLEGLGIQVWQAASAAESRDILEDSAGKNLAPDIGILDWRMPVEDGIDLCLSLRSRPATAKLPLILISYAATRGDAQKAREAGFDAFLIKPVTPEILAGAIHLVLEKAKGKDMPLITQHLVRESGLRLSIGPSAPMGDALDPERKGIPPRVLLAEDNEVNQKVARRMLEKLGCQVTLAANGLEALKTNLTARFDIILMDCMMPEMDGYESTRAIREREKSGTLRIPIVACTANATEEESRKCRDAGMDDFISKPYKPQKLKQVLDRWTSPPRPETRE